MQGTSANPLDRQLQHCHRRFGADRDHRERPPTTRRSATMRAHAVTTGTDNTLVGYDVRLRRDRQPQHHPGRGPEQRDHDRQQQHPDRQQPDRPDGHQQLSAQYRQCHYRDRPRHPLQFDSHYSGNLGCHRRLHGMHGRCRSRQHRCRTRRRFRRCTFLVLLQRHQYRPLSGQLGQQHD